MIARRVLGLLCFAVLAQCAACSSKCEDKDGDGRGKNCKAGPDCDDADPKLGASCDAAARVCAKHPFSMDCPCIIGESRDCYAADARTAGVGMCRGGMQNCDTGAWSQCIGEVLPTFEECNGNDDDCDGLADEGVLSPCGGCDDECSGGVWGPATAPFEAKGELTVTSQGELTLRLHESEANTVWVPNTGDGTLSKVDASTALEVARYRVGGDTPERIAIDYSGDAWVLSPALDGTSWLTKVAAGPDRCVDRDGDGLSTSSGPDDVLASGDDECVLLSMPIGDAGEVARALAVDGARSPDGMLGGDVWIGMQDGKRLIELDGSDGRMLRELQTAGVAPFDATFDPWGTLWLLDRGGALARVQPWGDSPEVTRIEAELACYDLDALASDAEGLLTLSGFACENVVTYDPRRDRWRDTKTTGVLDTRGVTVLGTDVWVSHTAGRISRVQLDPLSIAATYELAGDGMRPLETIAIGADVFGQIWTVSSMGAPHGAGVLTRFDPESERVTAQVPVGRLPRAQGDITGSRRLGEFAPEASAQHVFEGCSTPGAQGEGGGLEATDWVAVHLSWEAGDGASVLVEARHAATHAALAAAKFQALGSVPMDEQPFALPFATGGLVEVRVTLRTTGRLGAPRVALVGVEWHCPGPD
jgi:streptogramin lyase